MIKKPGQVGRLGSDGLLKEKSSSSMPAYGTGSSDQPAQGLEAALKAKREKLAMDRDHIGPESDSSV